jgi:oligopeptide/dipeptide ABC transporter ATP-binding protein
MNRTEVILEARNLHKAYGRCGFFQKTGKRCAVGGVSFALHQGETLGLVGESGCGKSTLARLLVRLEDPDCGRILFESDDITHWQGERLRKWRKSAQMIFQDAFSSLHPRMRVNEIIQDPIRNFEGARGTKADDRVDGLLEMVGLDRAVRFRFAHEFSGGQRQRIAIARGLALEPRLLICDECTANLDVSIQAQILHLIRSLKERLGLSLIFISHDLAVVQYISDRVAVMYLGRLVEMLKADTLVKEATHPYTRLLLSAVVMPDPLQKNLGRVFEREAAAGRTDFFTGCGFFGRCPVALERCRKEAPPEIEISPGHIVVCHRPELD